MRSARRLGIALDRADARPYAPRSIRVLVNPIPITLAERRSILQVLERDGAIEVFRQDKNRVGQFIAVTKTEAAAKELTLKHFISFDLPSERSSRSSCPGSREAHTTPREHRDEPPSNDANIADSGSKVFELQISENTSWNHQDTMKSSPYSASWAPHLATGIETPATAALRQAIPKGVTFSGLAFWEDRLAEVNWAPTDMDPAVVRERERAWIPSKMEARNAWEWRRAARILQDHNLVRVGKPGTTRVAEDQEVWEGFGDRTTILDLWSAKKTLTTTNKYRKQLERKGPLRAATDLVNAASTARPAPGKEAEGRAHVGRLCAERSRSGKASLRSAASDATNIDWSIYGHGHDARK